MRQVPAAEAKTHFLRLLDDVERGEEIVITRHGQPVVRLMPEEERRRQEIAQAIAGLAELRKHTKPATAEEIVSWIHEGHEG